MRSEFASVQENRTWQIIDITKIPNKPKPIPCRCIYKTKVKADDYLRYKARLVIKGFHQRYGIDYDEKFAPAARHDSFRLILAIAACHQ